MTHIYTLYGKYTLNIPNCNLFNVRSNVTSLFIFSIVAYCTYARMFRLWIVSLLVVAVCIGYIMIDRFDPGTSIQKYKLAILELDAY